MPITGNFNQENPTQEEGSVDNAQDTGVTSESGQTHALDNSGAEVSSTTFDVESTAETSQAEDINADVSEAVQSTSSVGAGSEYVDETKEQVPLCDESVSKPNSFAPSSSAAISKGFQDAFAAFASASYRQPPEESPMDIGDSVESIEAQPESVVSAAADSVSSTGVEPVVSSAIDSGQVTTSGESLLRPGQDSETVQSNTMDVTGSDGQVLPTHTEPTEVPEPAPAGEDIQSVSLVEGTEPVEGVQSVSPANEEVQAPDMAPQTQDSESQPDGVAANDSVYFIQMTDASGQIVTSIIDPNDIPSYSDSVVYKQCMKPDGGIETTIVYSGGMPVSQEEQPQEQPAQLQEDAETQQAEQQIIYAHDLNGQLTPIDSAQSANDVAPPGKQFVYMQDSTGRIIRTIMDANQTMVPGQQVYYTQSEDGRIITSVMDSTTAGIADEAEQQQQQMSEQVYQQQPDQLIQQQQQQGHSTSVVGCTAAFNIDNSMSGLNMLAELSHLTAGQATTAAGLTTEHRKSSTDTSSTDMDEFRPVAMVTRRVPGEDGLESVSSDIADLKVGETDSDSLDQSLSLLQGDGTGQSESLVAKIVSEMKGELAQPWYTVSRDNLFVQWQNLDAMCWMDVVLIMLVYSPTLRPLVNLEPTHELASTLLITLLKANRQAQILLQNILKKSNGAEISGLQTGAGNVATIQDPKTSKLVCKENMDEIGKAINILYAMREKIWQALQPRLRCERGKHNSPVLVLPLLVREKPAIKQMFTMTYRYIFKCEKCGYSQDDSHTKILPSIPAVPADFDMKAPSFVRNCFECQAPNQRMVMKFEGLHDFVQMHFVKGLPHSRFDELSFDFNDDHYEVTAVVHYKNSPDHFIAWVRNAPGPAWMECDDLKSVITRYLHVSPNIPPSQVHMVMWERRLTPQHTLVMRDTEDTKLLASLVLTVQQPNTQQTTDPAARPTGMPSAPATPTTSPALTQTQASTLLSGMINQAQTFSPYTPRGRGRGRGTRGTYNRGRGVATTTPVIRKVTPTITQITSPVVTSSPRPRTSPQIVRLPLAALASSGLNLRGVNTGGTRYVLVGNGAQGASASGTTTTGTGTPSKVVVVRSQGSAGGMSATQLLQLLQRSGAITQPGTRIHATVTNSNAATETTTAPTRSYIIQPDGKIVRPATSVSTVDATTAQISTLPLLSGTTTSTEEPVQEQTGEMLMETEQSKSEQILNVQTAAAVQPEDQMSDTANMPATDQPSSGTDATIISPEPGTSLAAITQPETVTSPNDVEVTEEQPTPVAKTLTLTQGQQQPSKYIQIPNPSGGGTLLCQLVMRAGKVVLVPVDKNTQAQVTGTSVLKLETSSSPSGKISIRAPVTSPQVVSVSSAGAVLAQLQQQQQQAQNTISVPGTTPTTTTVSTAGSPRFITLPGAAGGKKIQLITVPRGGNTSQANQPGTKTIIMSPSGSQQTLVSSAANLVTTRLMPSAEASPSEGHILSQSGNIVIRELKRPDAENITTLSTSLGTPGHDATVSRLTSTPAVSLLRDVSARSGLAVSSGTTSLLTSSQQQKPQESFRYILPGSNTTHILQTGASGTQGVVGQSGRAFTALSSSGTIIGGQLTPSPASAAVGTSPMDQDLALGDSDDSSTSASILTSQRRLSRDIDTTEYIPLGRGRARTRGGRRGRGRGGRTPRGGRGRSQLLPSDSEYISPANLTNKISTLSNLRQIGAHVIEAGSEAVDGVPVVSIPDFSADGDNQTEALSAAQSITSEGAVATIDQAAPELMDTTSSQVGLENLPAGDAGAQGPRVITQTIPSIKANHGFDILTQGILGAGNTTRPSLPPPKQARSLLTGVASSASSLLASLSATTTLSSTLPDSSSLLGSSVSTSQTMGQAEINTLIQAAEAAAKPIKPGSRKSVDSDSEQRSQAALPFEKDILSSQQRTEDNGFDVSDVLGENAGTAVDTGDDAPATNGSEIAHDTSAKSEESSRVMSVDESLVSAAERYRMPTELFQPDDESPEKPVKTEETLNKLGVDLPTKLFQDSEVSSHEDDVSRSPQRQNRELGLSALSPEQERNRTPTKPEAEPTEDVGTGFDSAEGFTSDASQVGKEGSESGVKSREQKRGRSRGRGRGRRGGRRKSDSIGSAEPGIEDVTQPLITSPREIGDASPLPDSHKEKLTEINSGTNKELYQHLGGMSPAKSPNAKSNNIGGFATDLLMESAATETMEVQEFHDKEYVQWNKGEKKGKSKRTKEFGAKSPTAIEEPWEQVEEKEKMEQIQAEEVSELDTNVQDVAALQSPTEVVSKKERTEKLRKHRFIYHPPFIRIKKEPANWNMVYSCSEDRVPPYPITPFNYKVLTGKRRPTCLRHPSLGPVESSFTCPPIPLPPLEQKEYNFTTTKSPAVVKRRYPKPFQRPEVDPSKEPTVIPLVAEDDSDPACTGGSVVTSPLSGEIFTGVVVKHKREKADWSFSPEEEGEAQEMLCGDELKSAQRRFCKQLLTVFYMEAGDFSLCDYGTDSDEEEDDYVEVEESAEIPVPDLGVSEFKSARNVNIGGANTTEAAVETGDGHCADMDVSDAALSKVKRKRGRPRSDPQAIHQPAKRARSSQDEDTSSSPNVDSPMQSSFSDSSVAAPSKRINGIDTMSSPTHSSQTASDSESGQQSPSKDNATPAGLSSPSRRSGRTPVPSKRVLDAWEDTPVRSSVKGRRTSQVSSDDEGMGYSSADMALKKEKKQTITPS